MTLPGTITNFGTYAFLNCKALASVTFQSGLGSIANYTFNNCTALTNVSIPNTVTNIGGWAFYYCSSLSTVTLPASVTSLGSHAFFGCTNLAAIRFKGNAPTLGSQVFSSGTFATAYYIASTTGWTTTFGGLPTATWVDITPPSLSIARSGASVILTWQQGVLLESTNLTEGPWTTNSSATSPYTVTLDSPLKFYRLISK